MHQVWLSKRFPSTCGLRHAELPLWIRFRTSATTLQHHPISAIKVGSENVSVQNFSAGNVGAKNLGQWMSATRPLFHHKYMFFPHQERFARIISNSTYKRFMMMWPILQSFIKIVKAVTEIRTCSHVGTTGLRVPKYTLFYAFLWL